MFTDSLYSLHKYCCLIRGFNWFAYSVILLISNNSQSAQLHSIHIHHPQMERP